MRMMMNRVLLLLFFLVTFLASIINGDWTSVTIDGLDEMLEDNEPDEDIPLNVTFHNNASAPIQLWVTSSDEDEDDKKIELIDPGKWARVETFMGTIFFTTPAEDSLVLQYVQIDEDANIIGDPEKKEMTVFFSFDEKTRRDLLDAEYAWKFRYLLDRTRFNMSSTRKRLSNAWPTRFRTHYNQPKCIIPESKNETKKSDQEDDDDDNHINTYCNDDSTRSSNMSIEFYRTFVVARNVLNQKDIDLLNMTREQWTPTNRSSKAYKDRVHHRYFGHEIEGEKQLDGHYVTHLNDIAPPKFLSEMKDLVFDMLQFVKNDTKKKIDDQDKIESVKKKEDEKKEKMDNEDWLAWFDNTWLHIDWDWIIRHAEQDLLNMRVFEYIHYSNLTSGLGWHDDDESVLTMVALLSDEKKFVGGELKIRVDLDKFKEHVYEDILDVVDHKDFEPQLVTLRKGDLVLFPSEISHSVSTLTKGSRDVLCVEWWRNAHNKVIGRPDICDFDARVNSKTGCVPLKVNMTDLKKLDNMTYYEYDADGNYVPWQNPEENEEEGKEGEEEGGEGVKDGEEAQSDEPEENVGGEDVQVEEPKVVDEQEEIETKVKEEV